MLEVEQSYLHKAFSKFYNWYANLTEHFPNKKYQNLNLGSFYLQDQKGDFK